MRIVNQSFDIIYPLTENDVMRELYKIEEFGRICYQSKQCITPDSYIEFIKGLIKRGHMSVIEHGIMSVRIVCDRGVMAEITRHRLASFSVESTRYVRSNKGISVIVPPGLEQVQIELWRESMLNAEKAYLALLEGGASPQIARSVLPNSLKTEIGMTANFREWRHIFDLRCSKAAHPQMRELMLSGLEKVYSLIPVVFDDIYERHFNVQ